MATTKIRSSSIEDGQVENVDLSATIGVTGGQIADNAVTLAKMAGGTDGNLITYDASGDPAYVLTGAAMVLALHRLSKRLLQDNHQLFPNGT